MTVTLLLFGMVGCNTDNYLTKEEVENQNKASSVITNILFDNDIDETATYTINKEGHVDISFDQTVPKPTYTRVVDQLRNDPNITSVWASQGGAEVCPLR